MINREIYRKLDDCISDYVPHEHRVYTTYCRTALIGVLDVIGARGKKVICPCFTCNTTIVSAIEQAGAKPVFVEVDFYTLEMVVDDLLNKLSKNTIAVISHHYYGYYTENVRIIDDVCKKNGLIHIEDCAHSLGAKDIKGITAGTIGDYAIYSFSKSMPSPAGGMITTNSLTKFEELCSRFHQYNFINEAFKNAKVSLYYEQIMNRYGCSRCLSFYEKRYLFFYVITKHFNLYEKVLGSFEKDTKYIGPFFPLDICMTKRQSRDILSYYLSYNKIRSDKSLIADRIKTIIDVHPYCNRYADNPMYLIVNKKEAKRYGLETINFWPEYQKLYDNQINPDIKRLCEEYTLMDLFQYALFPESEKIYL